MKLLSGTQSKILDLLKKGPALSVDEITSRLKMAKTASRRQLLSMEKRGLVEREYRKTERGRPALVFQLAPAARKLYPSKEAEVLNELMNYLVREDQSEILEKFFEDYWNKRLKSIMAEIKVRGRDDFETRLEVLKDALQKEGFMPSVRLQKQKSEVLLRECHCPIEAVTQITNLPCRLEQRLIAKVLNAPITSATLRNNDQKTCDFRLPTGGASHFSGMRRRTK